MSGLASVTLAINNTSHEQTGPAVPELTTCGHCHLSGGLQRAAQKILFKKASKPGRRVFPCNIVLDSFQSVNERTPTSKRSPGEVQDPSEFSKRFLNSCKKPTLQKKYILLFLKHVIFGRL